MINNRKNTKNMETNEEKFITEKANRIIELSTIIRSFSKLGYKEKNYYKNLIKQVQRETENLQYYINIL